MFQKLAKKPVRNYNTLTHLDFKSQKDQFCPVQPSRILICGGSGKGKTNLLLSLLFECLQFTRIYLNVKDPTESKYKLLQSVLDGVQAKTREDVYWINTSSEGIVSVDDLDSKHTNIIIFDDFVTDKLAHSKISDLFIRGRKKNATIIYLSQSYFHTPKLIRLQCCYKMFFKCFDRREVLNIYQNEGMGLPQQTFVDLFNEATKEPYSFLMLDNVTDNEVLKIRKNLDSGFISPH